MRGLGSPMAKGLGKVSSGAYLLRLSIIFVHSWLDMPQLRYGKHATVFVRGLGPLMAYAWRKKASLCLVRSVRRRVWERLMLLSIVLLSGKNAVPSFHCRTVLTQFSEGHKKSYDLVGPRSYDGFREVDINVLIKIPLEKPMLFAPTLVMMR